MNGGGRPRGRVLVVDDSESTRYIVATWLRRNGYQAIEAATGDEALARVVGTDLVILDVHLPDMTGFEVCAAIKADPATAAVPVLHVSATAVDVADRAAGLDGGADGYLTEPVDPDVLLATVRALLRYSGERRKAERLADRLGRLTRASLTINAAHTRSDLLATAATEAAALFEGPAAIVDFTDQTGMVAVAGHYGGTRQLRPPGGWVEVVDPATTGVIEAGGALDAWGDVLGKDVEAVLVVPAPARGSSGRVLLAVAVEPDSAFQARGRVARPAVHAVPDAGAGEPVAPHRRATDRHDPSAEPATGPPAHGLRPRPGRPVQRLERTCADWWRLLRRARAPIG